MKKDILKSLDKIDKKEQKIMCKIKSENPIKNKINDMIPEKLNYTLNVAFEKAFQMIFLKGTAVIEKTFDKNNINAQFDINNYAYDKISTNKNIKNIDKMAKKSNLLNNTLTTVSGVGMGILGMGLPDIPIFVSALLKGIYETALSYGFSYESEEEQKYILRLIKTALVDGELKSFYNTQLDSMQYEKYSFEEEIKQTAQVLSDEMLIDKFVQGIPIVGLIGGIANNAIYSKVSILAKMKYKKRYLMSKL